MWRTSHQKTLITLLICWILMQAKVSAERSVRARRPVDATLVDETSILTANSGSGTVSLVDLNAASVITETKLGQSITAVRSLGDGLAVAVDHHGHELLLLQIDKGTIHVLDRSDVDEYPVGLVIGKTKNWCAISSLWSRSITLVPLTKKRLKFDTTHLKVGLPFEPRDLVFDPTSRRIIVSDAFGSSLAIIRLNGTPDQQTLESLSLERIVDTRGHNIRQPTLAQFDGRERLCFVQMRSSKLTPPIKTEIHWGNYISSELCSIPLDSLVGAHQADPPLSQSFTLGDVGNGAADPESFCFHNEGHIAIAVGGLNQVAFFDPYGQRITEVSVGTNPYKIMRVSPGRLATINRLDDSISVIERGDDSQLSSRISIQTIRLGTIQSGNMEHRGERLFYSAHRSHDGWMSCHSCHTTGHTCGEVVETLSDGGKDSPKRILSLFDVARTEPVAWTGSMSITSQVRKTALDTMHGLQFTDDEVGDLVAFLESLGSPHLPKSSPKESANLGRKEFELQGCSKCHAPPFFTNKKTYDVGMSDELGNRMFNPPSLRGVRFQRVYFHDGRARTLREVLELHRPPSGKQLSKKQIDNLIRYLETL